MKKRVSYLVLSVAVMIGGYFLLSGVAVKAAPEGEALPISIAMSDGQKTITMTASTAGDYPSLPTAMVIYDTTGNDTGDFQVPLAWTEVTTDVWQTTVSTVGWPATWSAHPMVWSNLIVATPEWVAIHPDYHLQYFIPTTPVEVKTSGAPSALKLELNGIYNEEQIVGSGIGVCAQPTPNPDSADCWMLENVVWSFKGQTAETTVDLSAYFKLNAVQVQVQPGQNLHLGTGHEPDPQGNNWFQLVGPAYYLIFEPIICNNC